MVSSRDIAETRERSVRALQTMGQWLIDNADSMIPDDTSDVARGDSFEVKMRLDGEYVPTVRFETLYLCKPAMEELYG